MGQRQKTLKAVFSEGQFANLHAWKARYQERIGRVVTWPQLLLAYANSKVMP